jgi:hypothetical protein
MSDLPNGSKQESTSNTDASGSAEHEKSAGPTAAKETIRERIMREISQNPKWSEAKPSGQGFVIVGARPSSRKPAAFEIALKTLRQDEPALGNLSVTDQNWLVTALAHLIQIDESRRVENVFGDAHCIF